MSRRQDTTKVQFAIFVPPELPISVLHVKAENALMRQGILTIGDIIEHWDDLGELRGIGDNKVKEIRAAVFAYNLHLIWDDDSKMHRFAKALAWWKERRTAC